MIWFLTMGQIAQAEPSNTLYVGLNADLKGGSAESGRSIRMGLEFAIEDINRSGILGQYQIALIPQDHRGNPARGADNVREFAANPDVIAIIGGLHTPVIMHELPLVHEQGIPYLIPWAAGTPIISNNYTPNFVFRLSVRDEYAGDVLIRHAQGSGFTKVGLLLERTGWGRSNEKSMNSAASQRSIEVTETHWFNWGEQAFTDTLKQLKASGAQAVMLVGNAPEGTKIIKAMAALPKTERLPIISHWGITGGQFVKMTGLETLNQVDLRVLQTYLFNDSRANSIAQSVLQRYQAALQQDHTFVEAAPGLAHSYDLLHLLAIAIRDTLASGKPLTRANLRASLESVDSYQGLIRHYHKPFADHEALDASDYQIARYNNHGYIEPWNTK